MSHHAFVTILKPTTSVFTMFLSLSPAMSLYRVHQNQSTGEMGILPLAMFWATRHFWAVYGYAVADYFPLFTTYIIGDALGLVYVIVYYRYSTERALVTKTCAWALLSVVLVTAYTVLGMSGCLGQSRDTVESVLGYIMGIGSVLLFASPLERLRHVVRTKSAGSIPVALCAVGTVANLLWVAYGTLVHDYFVAATCAICFVFAAVQVVMYMIYRPRKLAGKSAEIELAVHDSPMRKSEADLAYMSVTTPRGPSHSVV